MNIFTKFTKDTPVIIQGITGYFGESHTQQMLEYGTNIVGGVTPGKGGKRVHNIPVYNSVREAKKNHHIEWSCLFVPARFAKNAALESLKNGLHIIIITEGIPVYDALEITKTAQKYNQIVIGPNSPGIATIGESKIGIIPDSILKKKGYIGVISRSGTLMYETADIITQGGFGISSLIGIGGDGVRGWSFIDALHFFEKDPQTKKILLIGEIGGNAEEKAAEYIAQKISKPVIAYIVGAAAPTNHQMGHAGAIIRGARGTAQSKKKTLQKSGVEVVDFLEEIIVYL